MATDEYTPNLDKKAVSEKIVRRIMNDEELFVTQLSHFKKPSNC